MGLGFLGSLQVQMTHEYICDEGTRDIVGSQRMQGLGALRLSAVSAHFFSVDICIPPESGLVDDQQSSKQVFYVLGTRWWPIARYGCFGV